MDKRHFRRYVWLPVTDLVIDAAYQREEDARWVTSKARNFDEDLFDPIAVSRREDGTYAVVDGQHRLALAKRVGNEMVPCFVHEGLSREEESNLFRRLQDGRKALKPFDVFRAALFENDDWAVECDRIATHYGLRIGATSDRDQTFIISGIRAMERVYHMGPKILDDTIRIVTEGWQPGVRQRTDASLIEGLGGFIVKHQGMFDAGLLLALMRGDGVPEQLSPAVLRADAQHIRNLAARRSGAVDGMGTRRWSVQHALEVAYNRAVPVGGKKLRLSRKPGKPASVSAVAA